MPIMSVKYCRYFGDCPLERKIMIMMTMLMNSDLFIVSQTQPVMFRPHSDLVILRNVTCYVGSKSDLTNCSFFSYVTRYAGSKQQLPHFPET